VSICQDEEEEETIQASRKSADCRHQKRDGGAAIGEVSPRRSQIPSRAGRRTTSQLALRPVPVGAPTETLGGEGSVVQNHIEQRFMNPDATVVFNKPELTKTVHKETNTGPGGANHFRKSFLGDLRNQ
jgi:hypothetical protein